MFSGVFDRIAPPDIGDAHVLLVVQDQAARYELAATLLDAGFRLTLASSAGIAGALLDGEIDLVVSAHPLSELNDARISRRARCGHPHVPILLLEQETAGGPGIVELVAQLIRRWPVQHAEAA